MPTAILKVILFAILYNADTGEVTQGGAIAFPDRATCEEVVAHPETRLPPIPAGQQLYLKCVEPAFADDPVSP